MFDWKRVNEANNSSLIFDCKVDVTVFTAFWDRLARQFYAR